MVSVAPKMASRPRLVLENIEDGETVYQRCIILKGSFKVDAEHVKHITVRSESPDQGTQFPLQYWPVADGNFKILALLSPGPNRIVISATEGTSQVEECILNLTYIPLLQAPPLHLVIMVAKDSPLLIDCPPAKHGGVSTAHASLEAAIAKFRMSAYMWQALTAEDMRMKGLGRRSFRLEEEWGADTTSSAFMNAAHEEALFSGGAMRATAKVHVIRSKRTVKEIRDEQVAQQSQRARQRDSLHSWFSAAIKAHAKENPSFAKSARPVVAGLILDSHYSISKDTILGHAALGAHDPTGLSLGVMGSHLTYSWPRFLEEVTACLMDTRTPGDTVGNDNGECGTMWEACSVGQGAFLHEVGHAFGAPHTTGIMARGYSVHWPRNFVARTAWCARNRQDGFVVVEDENEARWDLKDALSFSVLPHFQLPSDRRANLDPVTRAAAPQILVTVDGKGDATTETTKLEITSSSGLVHIQWNNRTEPNLSIQNPMTSLSLTEQELEARFPRAEPLRLTVLSMNGKDRTVADVWRLLARKSYVKIPGASFLLDKRSVMAKELEECDDGSTDNTRYWEWATLLQKPNADGTLARVQQIDVRTGMLLDGAYVDFDDGSRVNCGPRFERWASGGGQKHKKSFGGHASETFRIPPGQEIVKIEVSREERSLTGMRIHLRDGSAGGQLSGDDDVPETVTLSVGENERIVGFFGRSYWGQMFDALVEFGILTAPKDAELPDTVYKMTELQNTDGGFDESDYHGIKEHESHSETEDEDEDMDNDD